ncbi:MAG: Tn3 family transposase [Symploca sp. SIO1B1]|nr:Tn3 family transposase [Symploca sp. SIO1B1]
MGKADWEHDELIENWTLVPQELELVRNKVGGNQIGFALLLKHFQLFARFPEQQSSIPQVIISYIANQIKIPESAYSSFDWQGRSAKVYRVEIRRLFNFRVATVQDSAQISDWLIQEILPNEQRIEPITQIVYQRFRELQIEPTTAGQVERLIRSSIHQYETSFCQQVFDQLTTKNIAEEGLNVVERWNGVNDFIFYGKGG